MVKPVLRSTTQALAIGGLTVLTSVLCGCQGQSPFKWTANPMAQYSGLSAGNQKYVPGVSGLNGGNPFDLERPDCAAPYSVTVSPERGNLTATFNYDSEATYTISVHGPQEKQRPQITAVTLPFGSKVVPGNNFLNGGDIKLTWQPNKANLAGLANPEVQQLVLNIKSAHVQAVCGSDVDVDVVVNLVIPSSPDQPIVSFTDIPQTPIKYGEKVDFKVTVDDPAATTQLSPSIDLQNTNEAVSCDGAGQLVRGNLWQFSCELDTGKVSSPEGQESGTVAPFPFSVVAKSRAGNKLSSASTPASLMRISFPKNASKPGDGT